MYSVNYNNTSDVTAVFIQDKDPVAYLGNYRLVEFFLKWTIPGLFFFIFVLPSSCLNTTSEYRNRLRRYSL